MNRDMNKLDPRWKQLTEDWDRERWTSARKAVPHIRNEKNKAPASDFTRSRAG